MAKASPTDIFRFKNDLIDSAIGGISGNYSFAERWLLRQILERVLPELDVVDGVIQNTNKNINNLTSKLNAVFTELRAGQNKDIVNKIIKDFESIGEINSELFSVTGDVVGKTFDNAAKRVNSLMNNSIGFNPDGTIRPASFIDTISSNDAVNNKVRELAIRNIQGGGNIMDFTAQLKDQIVTNDSGLGVLQKHYKQVVEDRYTQFDRAQSTAFADQLGMNAFIYSGGKVDDTRRFCCQRNGLVFTREEASAWSSLSWAGKIPGGNPLIDMGGYNCRHSPQWISNREAVRRRPDLMIDTNGKLVYKPGITRQSLHQCA